MECPGCHSPVENDLKVCPVCGIELLSNALSLAGGSKVSQKNSQGVGEIASDLARFQRITGIVIVVVMLIIESVMFSVIIPKGLPIYLAALFMLITVGILALAIYQYRKVPVITEGNSKETYAEMAAKKYGSPQETAKPGQNIFGEDGVALNPGESVEVYATPIFNFRLGYTGISQVSVEKYTENTIIVTNRRVIFLTVALPGQGIILGGGSIDLWNDVLKRNTVRQLSMEAKTKLENGESLDHFPNDYWFDRDDIRRVEYLKVVGPMKLSGAGAIKFDLKSGKKFKYSIIESTDVDQLAGNLNAVKKMVL